MARDFQVSFLLYKKWSNMIVLPISIVLLLVALFFGGVMLYSIALLLLFCSVAVNFLWFVPTGYTGYKTRFTKLVKKARPEGINFLIPVIEDGKLFSIRETAYVMEGSRKVLHRNDIFTMLTLYLRLKSEYVPLVFKVWGENYYKDIVEPAIDATIDTFVGKLTYPQFQTQKEQIEKIISALVRQDLDKLCSEASKNSGTHEAHRAEYSADVVTAMKTDEDGNTIEVPKLELREWTETSDGVMFFDICKVKLNTVKFEKEYEEAQAEVAVAKANVAKAEQEKKAALILAETKKQAKILEAEAEAETIRKKGAAEAEAIELTGKKLRENPEYIAQTRAKNMPTTVAGEAAVSVLVGGETAKK